MAALALLLAACASDEPLPEPTWPRQSCTSYLFASPSSPAAAISVTGSWNNWASPGAAMRPHPQQPGWWWLGLELPPGDHGYLIHEAGGEGAIDARNPLTTFRGDDEVSLLRVADCRAPSLQIDAASGDDAGRVRVRGRFVAADDGGPLEGVEASSPGGAFRVASLDPASGSFELEGTGFSRGRHAVAIGARDGRGKEARATAAAWVKPAARSWEEGLLYQVVVDRFRGDGGAPLAPPKSPGGRAGGTLDGVRAELERGTFEALGATGLWLSPVYLNPDEPREGRDGRMYEGYHGYWPLDSRGVDPKIGGERALRELVDAAHRRGLRVLLDVVPNHVYEQNPLFLKNRGKGWFHEDKACVCGADGCDWGTHIQTCWFTPYLPDVRWQQPEVSRVQVDDVRWWVETFGVDGVRVDAVPMMPRAATRLLARSLRDAAAADERPFLLGEIFTGPGQGGIDQIRYFLGPDTLDSAFDFPLMWALRDALSGRTGWQPVEDMIEATDRALAGSGAVQARILGNHDTSRVLSAIAGDDGGDPWLAPPPRPSSPLVFARHRQALALLFTLPGLPVLYYGDEVALPGASDPDCRRVMPALDNLAAEEAAALSLARRLGSLRACSAALRRGTRRAFLVDGGAYGFWRDAEGERVLVLLSTSTQPTSVPLPPGTYRDALDGGPPVQGTLQLAPDSLRVLVSSDSPCGAM